jgi:hypothetical protein
MVESGEGSSNFDSADIRTARQIKVESCEGSSNFDSADIRTGRQGKDWWIVRRGAAILQ